MERDKERESVEQDITDDPVLMGAITLLLAMLFILNRMNMEVCTC